MTEAPEGQPRAVEHEMEALAGRDQSQTARQMLTAPGERRIVGNGEVEAHHPEQGVQEPFSLAQREMGEEPQGQGGLDGEIRVPPLPASPAASAGCPGGDRLRGHPHRHIATSNEGPVVGRPVRHAIFRLVCGMDLRLHPCRVTPAEARRTGQTAPPTEGHSCNNATRPPGMRPLAATVRRRPAGGCGSAPGEWYPAFRYAPAARPWACSCSAASPRPRRRVCRDRGPRRTCGPCALTRCRVVRGGGVMRCAGRRGRPCGAADGLEPPAPAAPDRRPAGLRRRAVPAHE